MREFKFRAWIKESGDMVLVEMIDFNEKYIVHEDLSFTSIDALEPSEPECVTDFGKCIIMQPTGVKDWKGKEIYEGDIIRINDNSRDPVGTVIFEMGAFVLELSHMITMINYEMAEILGNIYENPELMEGKE